MFIIQNILLTLAPLIASLLGLYKLLVIIRILISWVSPDPHNPIVQVLRRITDPFLEKFRRLLPPIGGIDFTPIFAIYVIHFFQGFIPRTLIDIAYRL